MARIRHYLLAFALAPATVFAADRWQVMTGDFKTRPMMVDRIDDQNVITDNQEDADRVSLDTFVQATRSVKIDQPNGLVLCLAGGDRLIGQPRKLDGQSLVWFAAGVGEVRVPIEQALGILRDKAADPRLDAERGEDVMLLLNGDTVRGIVTAFAERSITITPTGGDAIEVPVDSIRELLLATPPQGRGDRTSAAFTLRLTTGSVLSCQSLALEDEKITVNVAGGAKASLPTSIVASIEHTAGPVAWLSTRTPSEVVYTPYFTGDFTPKMDKTVTGEPIRLGNQLIQRGIGMHSRTRMTFPVSEGDKSFRTRYAIDPALGYANVDVRVLIDGKMIHENKGFKAGDLSPVVEADLAGAKSITLEVDYGQGYDIQDRLTWIEPAILRQ
jgi:hypothetical protein